MTRKRPSTPAFVITPDSTADAGEGAAGCAVGSQPCSGYRLAFAPKPSSITPPIASTKPSCPATFAMFSAPPGAKDSDCAYGAIAKMPSSTSDAPTTE